MALYGTSDELVSEHYERNFSRWVRKHSGEWVFSLLVDPVGRMRTTFYKTKGEFDRATREFFESYGPTFTAERLPKILPKRRAV